MHRTDPLYIIMTVAFAIVLLAVLLHKLRASLPGSHPTEATVLSAEARSESLDDQDEERD